MSNSDVFYPSFGEGDAWKVQVAVRAAEDDGSYLSSSECPYDTETITILKDLMGTGEVETSPELSEIEEVDIENIDLEEETLFLIRDLKKFKRGLKETDTSEMNSYFRLSTSLIEKLVSLKERASGINEVSTFTQTVLSVMEDELSPDQSSSIIKRLKSIMGEIE